MFFQNPLVKFALFLILFLAIVHPLHELSHYFACKSVGLTPTNFRIYSLNSTNSGNVECDGIEKKSNLLQFYFSIIPYLTFFVIILLGIFFKNNILTSLSVAIAVLFNISLNVYAFFMHEGDFYKIYTYLSHYRIITLLLVLFIFLLIISLIIVKGKLLFSSFKNK